MAAGGGLGRRSELAERKALLKFCAKCTLVTLSVVTFALAISLIVIGVKGKSETRSLRFMHAGGKGTFLLDPFYTLSASTAIVSMLQMLFLGFDGPSFCRELPP